jgi:Uma2 family endonuclease
VAEKTTETRYPPGQAWAEPSAPDRRHWTEADYLGWNTNALVEYSNGSVEVLPMPTTSHQLIVAFLYGRLLAYSAIAGGLALFAPLRVRVRPGGYREPDVVFMTAENLGRCGEPFWDGADLVMEVVSDENRRHDLDTKRTEYAAAGIPEYWVVDPQEKRVTVLRFDGSTYAEHGVFGPGEVAGSALLPGFEVDVSAALSARR